MTRYAPTRSLVNSTPDFPNGLTVSLGNVGIGNSSPATTLEIAGTGFAGLQMKRRTDNLHLSTGLYFDSVAASGTITLSGATLTVVTTTAGAWAVGQVISGTSITSTVTITALIPTTGGTGGNGTYTVTNSTSQTISGTPVAATGINPGGNNYTIRASAGGLDFLGGSVVNAHGGTSKVYFSSAGNVGIGTSTPTSNLTVNGNINLLQTYATYLVNSYYDTSWKYIGNGLAWGIGNNFGGITTGVTIATAAVNASGAGAALTWTPTFNIGTNGTVGIGTSSPAQRLEVQYAAAYILVNSSNTAYSGGYYISSNSVEKWHITNEPGAGHGLYIRDAANDTGVSLAQDTTAWVAASDARLKDVIGPIENATAKVNALSGVRYTWKRDADKSLAKVRVGLIAQDVFEVLPESVEADNPDLVTDDETGKVSGGLGVRYTEIVPLLVNAIKELAQRVEALEASARR